MFYTVILASSITFQKDQVVLTIPTLYEEYQIDFKLTFTDRGSDSGVHTIIRLTNTNSKGNDPGDGVPVFQAKSKLNKVYLKTRNNVNAYTDQKNHKLDKNVKQSIQIKQEITNGGFNLVLIDDGTTVFNEVFVDDYPNEHTNISVYVTDSFSTAFPAIMEDLVITTSKCVMYILSYIIKNCLDNITMFWF